jgi:hypothetical protein
MVAAGARRKLKRCAGEEARGGDGRGGEGRDGGEDDRAAIGEGGGVRSAKPRPRRAAILPAAAMAVKPSPERATKPTAMKAVAVTMMRKGPVRTNSGRRHCRPHGGRQMSWYCHGICYGVARERWFLYGRRRYPEAGLVHSTR